MSEIAGGCLCGAVRYRATEPPITSRVCWCRVCQYFGAGSATVNVCFSAETFEITGALTDYVSIADSGTEMHRRFCPVCGVHLFSTAASRPHLIFVRGGTLDDPELAEPKATIWIDAAPSWACIDADLPRQAGQPPPAR